jgi:ABC-type sugar transport system ATPase subunit
MTAGDCILKIKDISKTFPGVKALDRVSLDLFPGEVLGLCGENGAGKSTLMKIIAAIYPPDLHEGEILYRGQKAQFRRPLEAKKAGIILIFQELSLVRQLSVAENIFLGSLPVTRTGLVDWKKLYENTKDVLKEIECDVRPRSLVGDLSIAQQQMVEIARAIALGAQILILDEPTSSLTKREKTTLFKNIERLKSQGVGIIYITHKLDEILEVSDRIAVLRDGHMVGTVNTREAKLDDVVEMMIGRKIDDYYYKAKAIIGDEVLRTEALTINGLYEEVNFKVNRGEVLGFYGLVGAGRTEIIETIFGIRTPDRGCIFIEGKQVRINDSQDAVRMGMGLVPENRKEEGLVLGMSCIDNVCLAKLPHLQKNGFITFSEMDKVFAEYRERLSIATPSANQKVLKLSGGNQQKVVIGKWLCTKPRLLILDEPTRGIDVGSKAEIHKLITELAESGIAIIMISSEIPEIMGICNRVITISRGKITGEFSGAEITEKNLIAAITIQTLEKKTGY